MRRYLITTLFLTGLSLPWAAPAHAQGYESAVGWTGGVLINTSLNEGASGTDLLELKPDPIWLLNVHYDRWFGAGYAGIRARGTFSKPVLPWVQGDREISVYAADLGIMLRPIPPGPESSILPFISGGVGFIKWGLGDGAPTTFDPAGVTYGGEESVELVATAGLGIDFVTPWKWGEGPLIVRLEAQDHLQFSSPFEPANPEDADFGLIHSLGVVLGFHTGIGLLNGGE